MGETVLIILGFIALLAFPFVLGFLLNLILALIKNTALKKVLTIVFFVLFLPGMLAFWSADNLTESEKKWAPFSYSLRTKSRLVLITYVAYVIGYYLLFTKLF